MFPNVIIQSNRRVVLHIGFVLLFVFFITTGPPNIIIIGIKSSNVKSFLIISYFINIVQIYKK